MTYGQKVLVGVPAQRFPIWRLRVLSVLVRGFSWSPVSSYDPKSDEVVIIDEKKPLFFQYDFIIPLWHWI